MSRPSLVGFVLLCANLVPAQDPAPAPDAMAAAKAKLTAALHKTAALQDTGFRASWGADRKKKPTALELAFAGMSTGSVHGSWHADRQHVAFENETKDELVVAGRRAIAKDGNLGWRLRQGRFADGNATGFLPDVPLLLQQLAKWDLTVVQRAASALDDRPVEVISVSLQAEQVAEAVWAGLLPESLVTPLMMGGRARFAFAAGGGARPAAPAPDSTVDLAVTIDPATSLVHQIQFRGWTKENAGGVMAAGAIAVRGGAVVQVGGGGGLPNEEQEEEEEDPKAGKADAPMTWENGLPVRPRKKTTVMDYTVRLLEHGGKKAPELDEEQNKLLGR